MNNRSLHFANGFILLAITVLMTTLASLSQAQMDERTALVDQVKGERLVTFRFRADYQPNQWSREDIEALRSLDVVEEIAWNGAYSYTQTPRSTYVIPKVNASPNYLTFLHRPFVAGRDVDERTANTLRVVISDELAFQLFPDTSPFDVIGKSVTIGSFPYEIIGVYAGRGPAYQAQSRPPNDFGRWDIDHVYVRISDHARLDHALNMIDAFALERPNISTLEPVLYSEFVGSEIRSERTPYLGQMNTLSRWVVVVCLIVTMITLSGIAFLAMTGRSEQIGLLRSFGATRQRVFWIELSRALRYKIPIILLGGMIGLWVSHYIAGGVFWVSAGWGVLVGLISSISGMLFALKKPVNWPVVDLLKSGPSGFLRTRLNRPVMISLTGLIAVATLAGSFTEGGIRRHQLLINAIGATRAELHSGDHYDIRPRALVGVSDQTALAQAFPSLPSAYTLSSQVDVSVDYNAASASDVRIIAAQGDYPGISGTRLLSGTWWSNENPGVVIGEGLAQQLFGQMESVGHTITISASQRELSLPIVGVAASLEIDVYDTIKAPTNGIVGPLSAIPSLSPFGTIHVNLEDAPPNAVAQAIRLLNQRHPSSAPFSVRFPAESTRSEWDYLLIRVNRFLLIASLTGLIALIGIAGFLYAEGVALRKERALLRALGAPMRYLWVNAIGLVAYRVALVLALGVAIGVTCAQVWFGVADLDYHFPWRWIGIMAGTLAVLSLIFGTFFTRWSSSHAPMLNLKGER